MRNFVHLFIRENKLNVRINRILEETISEGPGKRFCIWFQGCGLHCPDCANRELWDFEGGKEYVIEEILEKIERHATMVEGITLLGGEPFEQAQAVERIVSMSRKCGLSVIIFSGYLYEELVKLDSLYTKKILQQTDILIDGRYEKEKHDLSRPWVGSVNQKYVFLTERYKNFSLDENKIEIRICRDGKIKINGMADIDEIKMWF